jgi:hypothetical protein
LAAFAGIALFLADVNLHRAAAQAKTQSINGNLGLRETEAEQSAAAVISQQIENETSLIICIPNTGAVIHANTKRQKIGLRSALNSRINLFFVPTRESAVVFIDVRVTRKKNEMPSRVGLCVSEEFRKAAICILSGSALGSRMTLDNERDAKRWRIAGILEFNGEPQQSLITIASKGLDNFDSNFYPWPPLADKYVARLGYLLLASESEVSGGIPQANRSDGQNDCKNRCDSGGKGNDELIRIVSNPSEKPVNGLFYIVAYLIYVSLNGVGLVCYYFGSKPENIQKHRVLAGFARMSGLGFIFGWLGLTVALLMAALSAPS